MPQPLDAAVQALIASAPRHPLAMPDPALCLAERARAFRARNDERCQTNQGRVCFKNARKASMKAVYLSNRMR